MQITPLPNVGAEITDVDLAAVTEDQFVSIQGAFSDHGLIFFRDQNLSESQHIEFAQRWGTINVNRFFAALHEHPQIALVAKEPTQTVNIGGGWHTDHSYDLVPALGSILVARELPPSGGDTRFVSMYSAYDALSPGLQKTLEGLRAVHSARHVFGSSRELDMNGRFGNENAAEVLEDPIHPVVIRHPLSGRKALYVNPGFTLRFDGWSTEDSADLLAHLYAVASDVSREQRFEWRPGSIAFWDNRATWHNADNDYQGYSRVMHRITIEGCELQAA